RNRIRILNGHSFTNDALHPGQADPELVLQQLAYRTKAAIAQVINIICASYSMQQINEVINGSNNIGRCDMFNGFVNNTVRNNLNNPALVMRREYTYSLQWNTIRI